MANLDSVQEKAETKEENKHEPEKTNRFEINSQPKTRIYDFAKVPQAELFSRTCVWKVKNLKEETECEFTGEQLEALIGVAPENLERRIAILKKKIRSFTKNETYKCSFAYWNGVTSQNEYKYKKELENSNYYG